MQGIKHFTTYGAAKLKSIPGTDNPRYTIAY